MKQIIQNFRNGETVVEALPVPMVKPGHILVKTHCSLISLGTEKMLVSFGQSSLLDKARSQPEKVRQVLNKVRTDGIGTTYAAVKRKLDTPIPLGYSAVGEVVAIGEGQNEFKIGDRVVTNGPHSEFVSVPFNLAALIPEAVSYEQASFTVLTAIGLQGIRLADAKFGEKVVVIGLGLIGLLTAQLLKASGCHVIGTDVDSSKIKLASEFGITAIDVTKEDAVTKVLELTNNVGADAVIISASTESNEVIRQAAEMSRKRGRIVLVGVVGLNIDRSTFYHKELSFQVSCSYGPGRYDPNYEQGGNDYPLAFVRWTEKRNFEAVLSALKSKQLLVDNLITERVAIEEADKLYKNLLSSKSLATLIEYTRGPTDVSKDRSVLISPEVSQASGAFAVIGTGNFSQATLLPNLKKANAKIKYLVSSEGLSSTLLAKKFKIPYSSTDFQTALNDKDVKSIFIVTRHDLHAKLAVRAIEAKKHVFVEKPLALNEDELRQVLQAAKENKRSICVGFNRRFSPHSLKAKDLLGTKPSSLSFIATMNAGFIPKDHWVHDLKIGGGRVLGEACHLIDLFVYFSGSLISEVCMQANGAIADLNSDNVNILLKAENGSTAVINYLSNGSPSSPKERIEIFSQGRNLVIDNFRRLYAYGFKSIKSKSFGLSNCLLKTPLDKGHLEQFRRYEGYINAEGKALMSHEEIENVSLASFAALDSLKEKRWIRLSSV